MPDGGVTKTRSARDFLTLPVGVRESCDRFETNSTSAGEGISGRVTGVTGVLAPRGAPGRSAPNEDGGRSGRIARMLRRPPVRSFHVKRY